MSWPAALPRAVRGATDAGAHGFCFHHQPLLGQELFEEHQVELTTNLLAVVARGNLTLQRGEETRVLQEGEAVLVAAGALCITEVPATAAHAADIYFYLFDDRLLRQRFTDLARVEGMANTMVAASTELCVLPNFVSHLPPVAQITGVGSPYGLTQMLNVSFNHGWRGAWMFLQGFLAHRRSLHLYLERHVLPVVSTESIMSAYAGGPRRFRRDFRAQYDVPLERWLTWRRLDLARVRLRHDRPIPVEGVAAWVGYRNFQRFRQQFHARFGLWPEEQYCYNDYEKLSEAQKAAALAPFWHWGYPHGQLARDAERAFLIRAHRKQYPRWEQRRQRRIDAQIRQEDIARAAGETRPFVTTEATPSQAVADELPAVIDITKFIELEPYLKSAAIQVALAA